MDGYLKFLRVIITCFTVIVIVLALTDNLDFLSDSNDNNLSKKVEILEKESYATKYMYRAYCLRNGYKKLEATQGGWVCTSDDQWLMIPVG